MKKIFVVSVGLLAAASVFTAEPARAGFMPVIDEFWVIRDGVENFRDSFNDGVVPPSGPEDGIVPSGDTYTVQGPAGMTSEAGGKLTMTPALGSPTQISGGFADTFTGARRIRSTNPGSSAFLGLGQSFEIHGLFDLTGDALPGVTGQSFGIRASDRSGTTDGVDVFSLSVGISSISGDLIVRSADLDFSADTSTLIGVEGIQSFIDAATALQIELIISKAAGSDLVDASFSLYGVGGFVAGAIDCAPGVTVCTLDIPFTSTPAPLVQIYTDADFTRPQFFSSNTGVRVPEPATLAILGLGLAGLGLARRRRAA